MANAAATSEGAGIPHGLSVRAHRALAWIIVGLLLAFLLNVYLTYWQEWPGAESVLAGEAPPLAWGQAALYLAAVGGALAWAFGGPPRALREDAHVITGIAAYIVKAAFWAVLLIGIVDAAISFLRVEGFLDGLFGHELATELGRNAFRAPRIHLPLIGAAVVIATFTRTLGFPWLALLVVVAELQIVISRFVFSYEQAFMGDLVRFWYGGLFLFSSAFTLIEEGHVRVDVLYHAFSVRTRGLVNAVGSLLLGLPFCAVILTYGLGERTGVIASPLLALEVSQSGFGMYVKYLLAAQLGVFAVTMTIQFASFYLHGVADFRGDPGGRVPSATSAY